MGVGDGEVLGPPVRILGDRPDERAMVIVLLAEGFREEQQDDFNQACDAFARRLQAEDWFTHRLLRIAPIAGAVINVYRLNVASIESGIDDPAECGGTGASPRTYFNVTHCAISITTGRRASRRVLGAENFLVWNTLTDHAPGWDFGVIIANTRELGAIAQPELNTAIVTLHPCWLENAMHELGHLLFDLADEYEYLSSCEADDASQSRAPAGEPLFPNVTAETDPARLKWRDLVTPGVPVPTMQNEDCSRCDPRSNVLDEWDWSHIVRVLQRIWYPFLKMAARLQIFGHRPFRHLLDECYWDDIRHWLVSDPDDLKVGLFEGANFHKCANYRPVYNCRMRDQFRPYCPVCRRAIAERLRTFG